MAGGLRKYLLKKLRFLRPAFPASAANQIPTAGITADDFKKCSDTCKYVPNGLTGSSYSTASALLEKRTGGEESPGQAVSRRPLHARVRPMPAPSGSSSRQIEAVRCRRLMREFREISRQADRQSEPVFRAELVDDCLFEWRVFLYQLDPTSEVHADMVELNIESIELRVSFPDSFPFAPPFIRVVAPRIERGFVMEGGSICMELLTPRGWASAYTIEAIITQFAASLVKGQARIDRRHKKPKLFSRKLAETSFRGIVRTHEKYGWVTPPLSDG